MRSLTGSSSFTFRNYLAYPGGGPPDVSVVSGVDVGGGVDPLGLAGLLPPEPYPDGAPVAAPETSDALKYPVFVDLDRTIFPFQCSSPEFFRKR